MEVSGRKVLQLFCEPCGDNGQKLLAAGFCVDCSEFLCRDCYNHHLRARPFRNHVLQDETLMPKTKHSSTPLKPVDNENECSKHKGEPIKFYCRSDCSFGCGSCRTLDHHDCDKPIYIEGEYQKFETKLGKLNEQLEYHSNRMDQNSKAINSRHSKVSQDIRFFMTKVKQYFENLENSMIKEADKLKENDEQKMDAISTSCMTLKNYLQSLTSDLFKLQQTKQNKKLYTIMEEAGDQIKRIKINIDQLNAENKVHIYSFVPDMQIEDMMKTLTIIGKLAIEKDQNQTDMILKTSEEDIERDGDINPIQTLSKPRQRVLIKNETEAVGKIKRNPFKPKRASSCANINVESTTDTGNPFVTGLALIPNNHLILTDHLNSKVKLVSVTQGKLISELKLSSIPHDITAINDNQFAMTMPSDSKIQMLSISSKKISLGQTIKVNGQCYGIVHNDGTFIVTFVSPAKVELISMTGAVLRVIDKGTNREPLFAEPRYIALTPDGTHVYIADFSKHTVTCMTLDGEVKGVYKGARLIYPCGLTVDKTGSVYVVHLSLLGGYISYIYQISADCSQSHELLGDGQGLRNATSIAYCHKEDKLYVGSETTTIKVFKLT